MLSDKEKLREELKLLKESLELDVITKDEYENAKARIEGKLRELEQIKEEPKPEIVEIKPEAKEETIQPKVEEKEIEVKEITEKEPVLEQKKLEDVEEEKPIEEKKPEIILEEEKKGGKKIYAYIAIIIILCFVAWYSFFSGDKVEDVGEMQPVGEIASLIACSSNEDCVEEGKIGVCRNPGQENAECEYVEYVEIKLTVLNNDCFNCDTGRVLSILNDFFPNLDVKEIGFETEAGKEIVENFNINVLPAYIFDSSFKEALNYDKFSSSFNEVDGNFVMKNTVANSNYYFNRMEIEKKLDLFVKADQVASSQAEENLQEFLEAFDGVVIFEKHDENSEIAKSLGINTFPAFLINNKIKFSGVQAADKIRENFCEMNKVSECSLELSKSLV